MVERGWRKERRGWERSKEEYELFALSLLCSLFFLFSSPPPLSISLLNLFALWSFSPFGKARWYLTFSNGRWAVWCSWCPMPVGDRLVWLSANVEQGTFYVHTHCWIIGSFLRGESSEEPCTITITFHLQPFITNTTCWHSYPLVTEIIIRSNLKLI